METATGISAILSRTVLMLREDPRLGPRLCNRWLPATTWVDALAKSGIIDNDLIKVDVRKFNTSMSSRHSEWYELMTHFDGSNTTGVFRVKYQKKYFYFFTDRSKQVSYPFQLNDEWRDRVIAISKTVLLTPATRSRCVEAHFNEEPEDQPRVHDHPTKRQRIEELTQECLDTRTTISYWPDSPEVYQLFMPRQILAAGGDATNCAESPQEVVEQRIKVLKTANQSEDSWRNIIAGRDPNNFCSKSEIFEVRQRALFLCCAYQLALKHMNKWTWHECCKQACTRLNDIGLTQQATSYKTVANWNILYRSLDNFPHPNPYVQCGKRPLPRLFEAFPSAKDDIASFAVRKLDTLTIEVHEFFSTVLLPKLIIEWKDDKDRKECCAREEETQTTPLEDGLLENEENDKIVASFLNAHGLATLSMTTVWRWMHLLGFSYYS